MQSLGEKMNELIKNNVRVSWVELGEGKQGDYDPNDPNDVELLRFDVERMENGTWEILDGGSYCTQVPVSATPEQRRVGLKDIMNSVYNPIMAGDSIRRMASDFSWMSIDSLEFFSGGLNCPVCKSDNAEIALREERKQITVVSQIVNGVPLLNSMPLVNFNDKEESEDGMEKIYICLESGCGGEFTLDELLAVN